MVRPRASALVLAFVCLGAGAGPARADESLRCGPRLVSVGESALRVRALCGAPDAVHRRVSERLLGTETAWRRETHEIETWSYQPEPGGLSRILRFVDGRLRSIETGARHAGPEGRRDRCARGLFSPGTAAVEIAATCGAPLDRRRWSEEVGVVGPGDAGVRAVRVEHERWAVSAGPGRRVRWFVFESGRLVRIESEPAVLESVPAPTLELR